MLYWPGKSDTNQERSAMEIRPVFYDNFICLAGRCRHSCCRGWEIDVDEVSLQRYRDFAGPLGEELRASLEEKDGTWSFRLTGDDDCPFLRRDGLCRLILELGEDSLCDICALHPRFFQDIAGHELAGVGLSCEASAALLLDLPGELLFLNESNERLTLSDVLSLLGQRPAPGGLHFSPRVDGAYYRAIFRRYGQCEAIDQAWTRDLAALAADPEGAARRAEEYTARYDRDAFERLFTYILYRQLEFLEPLGLPALLEYAGEAADFIFLWSAVTGDLPECLRRWSAQMEYSEENTAFLLKGRPGEAY